VLTHLGHLLMQEGHLDSAEQQDETATAPIHVQVPGAGQGCQKVAIAEPLFELT
jgi:hypothetical protein